MRAPEPYTHLVTRSEPRLDPTNHLEPLPYPSHACALPDASLTFTDLSIRYCAQACDNEATRLKATVVIDPEAADARDFHSTQPTRSGRGDPRAKTNIRAGGPPLLCCPPLPPLHSVSTWAVMRAGLLGCARPLRGVTS